MVVSKTIAHSVRVTAAVLCVAAGRSDAAILTVDDDLVDLPTADFMDIQSAVNAAGSGDEVHVYPGLYTAVGDQVVDVLGKSIVLRGVMGAEQTIVDGEGSRRCLISVTGAAAATQIEDLTFRRGAAETAAGIWIASTSPTFRRCIIEDCEATTSGGGIVLNGSSTTFMQCVITGNRAGGVGGGVCASYADAMMQDCVITANTGAGGGGGVWADSSSLILIDCDVTENMTDIGGGGIRISGPFAKPRFERCSFSNNVADGPYSGGGGVYSYECAPEFIDCVMAGNDVGSATGSGGGVLCWNSQAVLTGCEITDNDVTHRGGGLWAYDCDPALTGCTLANNTASLGGGLACTDHADPTLHMCEVSGNHADSGGGVWCIQFSRPHLIACLVRDNTADIEGGGIFASTNGCSPAASNTSFCNNLPTHIDGWPWQDLGGNCFIDTCVDVNGDGLPDACQCLSDFNGDEHVGIDDMLQLLAAWGCTACPIEDLNGDGIVGIDDLLSIMANWGECG